MTSGDRTTENEELSGNVLGLIGAYRMGAALNAQDLYLKNAPKAPPPAEGDISDGVSPLAGHEQHTVAM
jgi:hypothetical protein